MKYEKSATKSSLKIRRESHPLARTPVVNAGKAVCQETDGTDGGWGRGFVVMLPTGEIKFAASKDAAETLCRKFFKRTCPKNEISFGTIVWHFIAKSTAEEVLQPT